MRNSPSNKTANAPDRSVDDTLRLALVALNQQRPAEAEQIARGVLERQPRHIEALHLFGLTLLAQKRPHEALAPLAQAVRMGRQPIIETHYALALRDVGQPDKAIEWLQRATTFVPPFARAFHELGILFCSLRRYEEAEAVLKHGLLLAPSAVELAVELGGVHICRADSRNAMAAFARVLAGVPGHIRALHGSGTALLFEGEFEQAAERFRQVLSRNPNHVRAHLDLAHCMLELGRLRDAVETLRSLVRNAPQQYGKALKILVSSGRGQFWLRPSAAAAALNQIPPFPPDSSRVQ